ncbi:MAG: hypothetical protein GY861_15285 [bacterium]|nr:hypothetical protein [bacterium]
MSSVLGKISTQTDIAILYDEKLANLKITGHYKDIKFSEAINRLFSETNKSIQVFKNEKKIIVKTFGAKQFILASSIDTGLENPSSENKLVTVAELEKMHKQQYKEYKERIANDNEVFEGGITRGEVRLMHEQQRKQYRKRRANDAEEFEGGITRGEVRKMHGQQEKQYKKRRADDAEEFEGGVTRGEIRVMHEKQKKAYEKKMKDTGRYIAL